MTQTTPAQPERQAGPIRVFLLDDHEVVRRGLKDLLEVEGEFEVVGEASTAAEALARVPAVRPQVAVLDVRLRVKPSQPQQHLSRSATPPGCAWSGRAASAWPCPATRPGSARCSPRPGPSRGPRAWRCSPAGWAWRCSAGSAGSASG
ncbi:MAG TPA: response regulator transcription factor [Actinocrinis sp.]|jgi:hypothetical protein